MTLAPQAHDPVDVAASARRRFATHLDLLAHQLGDTFLEPVEHERLVAVLEAVDLAIAQVSATIARPRRTPG